ncbi:MAG: hypothetical protein ACJAXN_002844 [Psychromonas sp.]|jgi:hypothetical protein
MYGRRVGIQKMKTFAHYMNSSIIYILNIIPVKILILGEIAKHNKRAATI